MEFLAQIVNFDSRHVMLLELDALTQAALPEGRAARGISGVKRGATSRPAP